MNNNTKQFINNKINQKDEDVAKDDNKVSSVDKEYMEELVDYLVSLSDEEVDEYLEIDDQCR